MIQVITSRRPNTASAARTITYKFATIEAARAFISRFNLENKIIDILF